MPDPCPENGHLFQAFAAIAASFLVSYQTHIKKYLFTIIPMNKKNDQVSFRLKSAEGGWNGEIYLKQIPQLRFAPLGMTKERTYSKYQVYLVDVGYNVSHQKQKYGNGAL